MDSSVGVPLPQSPNVPRVESDVGRPGLRHVPKHWAKQDLQYSIIVTQYVRESKVRWSSSAICFRDGLWIGRFEDVDC